jgi:hypothetical protein
VSKVLKECGVSVWTGFVWLRMDHLHALLCMVAKLYSCINGTVNCILIHLKREQSRDWLGCGCFTELHRFKEGCTRFL